ncbi:MAG TPA: nucleoside triphosphate pyrophosphohydrolase [Ruminococcaceae bacterium]|nr:nucleoside triphosphate pyrophosphohydrolase [Oscillospiraceae bacterium]
MNFKEKSEYGFEDLVEIVRILRAPDGCPWDREQTHHSIRANFIEETYEAIEAIDTEDSELLKEELGDVLLQVALHSEMESEQNRFDLNGVVDGLCKKLIIRHPHVFGDKTAGNVDEALSNWDEVKRKTKSQKNHTQAMQGVSKALPSLIRSEKIQRKARKAGLDFGSLEEAFSKLNEECTELEVAIRHGNEENRYEEIGDVLFSVVNVARFLNIDSEHALQDSCEKFIRRFEMLEKLAEARGISMDSASTRQLDSLWDEVKINLKGNNGGNLS